MSSQIEKQPLGAPNQEKSSITPSPSNNGQIADQLNEHLESGGIVQITTYEKSTVYKQNNAGVFVDRNGSLYVQRGRNLDRLSFGNHILVSIRLGRIVKASAE